MWSIEDDKRVRQIAERNHQDKVKLGFIPKNEFERKSWEIGDWLSAELEYMQIKWKKWKGNQYDE